MQDIIYVAIPTAFFAVCVAYVRWLDRLVRDGEEPERATDVEDRPQGVSDGGMVEVRS